MRRTRPQLGAQGGWWPGRRRRERVAALDAAVEAAVGRGWPVVPGAWTDGPAGPCSCGETDCPVPGEHPDEPPLAAATADGRMVRWWWEQRRPGAPVLVATGSRVCAVSLPAEAGMRCLLHFTGSGVPLGPVLASPVRYSLLVAPYTLEELGGLLADRAWVPGSLRYHGPGGYLMLPPGRTSEGPLRWVRPPVAAESWLPPVASLLDGLIAAATGPDGGARGDTDSKDATPGDEKSDRWRRGMHQRSDLFRE